MRASDRDLLTRVLVGASALPAVGAVLVAIAGWPFNAQARAMLAASGITGGAVVGMIQLWDRRREVGDVDEAIAGLHQGVQALNENLAGLVPPPLPPQSPPHPEMWAGAIPTHAVTVPPTGQSQPTPARFDERDLIEDVWSGQDLNH